MCIHFSEAVCFSLTSTSSKSVFFPLCVSDNIFIPLPESGSWSSRQNVVSTAQATLSRRKSADQAELQAAESLADLDRILLESLNKNDPTSKSVTAASSMASEAVSSEVSQTLHPNQHVTVDEPLSQPADVLSVPDCSTSTETVSEVNQLSEGATVSPSKSGDSTSRVAKSNQSNTDVALSSQSKGSPSHSSDKPDPVTSIVAASKRNDSSQVMSDHQSEGSLLGGKGLQIPISYETDSVEKKDEVSAPETEDGSGQTDGKVTDNVQVRLLFLFSDNYSVKFKG